MAEDRTSRILRMDQTGLNLEVVYDPGSNPPPGTLTQSVGLAFAANGDLFVAIPGTRDVAIVPRPASTIAGVPMSVA